MMGVTNTKNIEVLPWEASYQNARHPVDPPNVVIQAFSCELPARYLQNLLIAPQKPILINLEYLSAEAWVADFHSKPSPQGHGLQKYFFFPGFQDNTGGLLLDPIPSPQSQVPTSLVPIWKQCRADSVKISVFSYPGAPIKLWLDSFNQLNAPCDVLLAFGNAELLQLQQQSWTNLNLISMPFIPQDDYDWLLSQCELNIVRGEDSFIRAQLAGKPFIWNIYPQDDGAHEVKLNAFLNLYLRNTAPELKQIIHQAMNWSDPQQWWSYRAAWESHTKDWRDQILKEQADGGLAARLLRFVS